MYNVLNDIYTRTDSFDEVCSNLLIHLTVMGIFACYMNLKPHFSVIY